MRSWRSHWSREIGSVGAANKGVDLCLEGNGRPRHFRAAVH